MAAKHVILFGETGAGKSSVVNLLLGTNEAPVSNDAKACTFFSKRYHWSSGRSRYVIHDTAGLDEGCDQQVKDKRSVQLLYDLLRELSHNAGIHMLIFCMRGRVTKHAQRNYKLFYEILCDTQVPIMIIVTGLEDEDPMEKWWERNHEHFKNYGMSFSGHACICATRGRPMEGGGFVNDVLYAESKVKVEKLILSQSSRQGNYYMPEDPIPWLVRVLQELFRFVGMTPLDDKFLNTILDMLEWSIEDIEKARQCLAASEKGRRHFVLALLVNKGKA